MAEILETLGNSSQLSKVLCELLGQIATSAILKTNENDKNSIASSSLKLKDETSPVCKSVPVSKCDGIQSLKKSVSDDESCKSQAGSNNVVVDSSLGRPRYQWHERESGSRITTSELNQLYSVYVGHLPKDITQSELNDLFCDVGEIADSFVFPPTSGHTYTYGFVRFYTLDEAKDAVKEKNLKVIGSRHINVELSSSTRRQLQTSPEEEESSPLLRKDYPKVPRQSLSDNDEKQVIDKIKASLRKFNSSNICSFGNYTPEEMLENIKAILKMLINFPMTLADPSADRGDDKSRTSLSDSGNQCQTHAKSLGVFTNQQTTVPRTQTTCRLPSFALEATKNTDSNIKEPFSSGNDLPYSGNSRAPLMEENNSQTSKRVNSSLINKVREFLDSSSGEDNSLPISSKHSENSIPGSKHSSASSTDDERHDRKKTESRFEHYNKTDIPSHSSTPDLLSRDTSKHESEISQSSASDASENGQNEHTDYIPAQHYKTGFGSSNVTSHSINRGTLRKATPNLPGTYVSSNNNAKTQPVPCAKLLTSTGWVSNASSFPDTSSNDNHTCHPSIELPNSIEQSSVKEIKHSTETEKQNFDGVLLQQEDIVTQSCPRSRNGVFKNAEQVSNCSRSTLHNMSQHVPQYTDSVGQSSCKSSSSDEMCKPVHANSLTFLSTNIISMVSEASQLPFNCTNTELIGVLGKETLHGCERDKTQIHNRNEHSMTELPNQHDQLLFRSQDMHEKIKTVDAKDSLSSSTNLTLLEQPSPSTNENLQHREKSVNVNGLKKPSPPVRNIEPKISNHSVQTSLSNSWSTERASSNGCYDPLSLPDEKIQATMLQEPGTLVQEDKFPNLDQSKQRNLQSIEDITTLSRSLLPAGGCCSSSSIYTPEVINNAPGRTSTRNVETRALVNGSHSSNDTAQSKEEFSTPDEFSAINSYSLALSQNGKLDSQTNSSGLSSSVQQLVDGFRTNHAQSMEENRSRDFDESAILKNEYRCKSSGRRVLAPSFTFSASKKEEEMCKNKAQIDTPRKSVESSTISNFPANETAKIQCNRTTDVMIKDSAIVSMPENESWESEFDFGFESNDVSPLDESSEPRKNLLDSSCPSDDVETIKLKDELKEHVLKREELQGILNKYPQRRRKRLPCLFDEHARGLELETRLHDAEILLQKKEEMWTTRSSERELAYEKEMFHAADDNQLLTQFAREMRKESIRNEISITELKCKILELNIEQSRHEEMAQTS